MTRQLWAGFIALYVATMITYHRFENSDNALDILGNIPTFFASIAGVIAGLIALKTYIDSKRKEPSKVAFEAYQDSLKSLIAVLSEPNDDKAYKLYYLSVCHETFSKIEPLITEQEHKSVIAVTHNILKHYIGMLLRGHGIGDYFYCDKPYEKEYRLNVTDSANALYEYWLDNIRGHSNFFKQSKGKMEFFAASPYGISEDVLIKALAIYANDNLELSEVTKRIKTTIELTETNFKHELIELAELFPVAVAFLLLRKQTSPYRSNNGWELGLKNSYSDDYWICYHVNPYQRQVEKLPNLKVMNKKLK
ncbi:hypothetical protein EM59_016420 [Vibrio parahaemolyticus]|uniref:hypothetical protein n=1 Tax=Vibrio parahaemolyticus TaxID=670 RepID=UPI0004D414BD|nr:hypothetical protein [Vibrio parahaemolyticus]EGQ7650914.1 hypothetical protein [Vibrio parahaemolyticus]EGQ9979466.1 hypothetical protein [Vibrio parahaemolyticus]EJG1824796.1 hypothetical protein [Vibrio parahaemolyticus]ELB2744105.1 hypothetical protein [Vibrio parahaemolyticus]ELC9528604.1 hypothetical protein [Vibrio parahaemolyticus]